MYFQILSGTSPPKPNYPGWFNLAHFPLTILHNRRSQNKYTQKKKNYVLNGLRYGIGHQFKSFVIVKSIIWGRTSICSFTIMETPEI